jgi:hypothetical protein
LTFGPVAWLPPPEGATVVVVEFGAVVFVVDGAGVKGTVVVDPVLPPPEAVGTVVVVDGGLEVVVVEFGAVVFVVDGGAFVPVEPGAVVEVVAVLPAVGAV